MYIYIYVCALLNYDATQTLNYVGVNAIGVSKFKVYLIVKTMSVCGTTYPVSKIKACNSKCN